MLDNETLKTIVMTGTDDEVRQVAQDPAFRRAVQPSDVSNLLHDARTKTHHSGYGVPDEAFQQKVLARLELLKTLGVDLNKENRFHNVVAKDFARYGTPETILRAAALGVDFYRSDQHGKGLAWDAVATNSPDALRALVKTGVRFDEVETRNGDNLAHCALMYSRADLLPVLQELGTDMQHRNNQGNSLHDVLAQLAGGKPHELRYPPPEYWVQAAAQLKALGVLPEAPAAPAKKWVDSTRAAPRLQGNSLN